MRRICVWLIILSFLVTEFVFSNKVSVEAVPDFSEDMADLTDQQMILVCTIAPTDENYEPGKPEFGFLYEGNFRNRMYDEIIGTHKVSEFWEGRIVNVVIDIDVTGKIEYSVLDDSEKEIIPSRRIPSHE